MKVRAGVLFIGAVAVLVGVVGLLVPMTASTAQGNVGCGSAVFSDLPAVGPEAAPEIDYAPRERCSNQLSDRREWTITLVVVGAVVVAGTLVVGWRTRARSSR